MQPLIKYTKEHRNLDWNSVRLKQVLIICYNTRINLSIRSGYGWGWNESTTTMAFRVSSSLDVVMMVRGCTAVGRLQTTSWIHELSSSSASASLRPRLQKCRSSESETSSTSDNVLIHSQKNSRLKKCSIFYRK